MRDPKGGKVTKVPLLDPATERDPGKRENLCEIPACLEGLLRRAG